MAKRLGYADAVKLLGGDSAWAEILGRLVTASVSAVPGVGPLLSFLNLTDSVQQAGQAAITQIRTRARGLARFERSQLIEAAHAVLVVSAFFDALDILDADLRAGLNSATLDLTAREQAVLATGRLFTDPPWHFVGTLIQPGGIPGVHDAWATEGGYLLAFYQLLALHLPSFAAGTAVWDERDETTRDRWMRALSTDLPLRACLRYEGTMAQLAGEFPEFAFWASRAGVSAILDQLTAVRHSIAQVLAASVATASQQPAAQVRRDLATLYRARVSEPVAEAPATPGDVTLPRLRDLYVAPACRKLPADRWEKSGGWLTEAGWTAADQPADLWTTVLQHLLSTEATQVPMVLFGQPGAGKSMFTQMLAAELDARDFLVVRVELRSVPADASIARQITAALESLTLRSIDWPDLAETAGSAQPVIILDGFDELLQASGRDHQNYLEQVQEFQRHEARLGRPTAVLVTSRTAVANQVRHPEGTVALRLEEFGMTRSPSGSRSGTEPTRTAPCHPRRRSPRPSWPASRCWCSCSRYSTPAAAH